MRFRLLEDADSIDIKALRNNVQSVAPQEQDYRAFILSVLVMRYANQPFDIGKIVEKYNDIWGASTAFYETKDIADFLTPTIKSFYTSTNVEQSADPTKSVIATAETITPTRHTVLFTLSRFSKEIKGLVNQSPAKVHFVMQCYLGGKMNKALKDKEYCNQVFNTVANYKMNTGDFCYVFSAYTLAFDFQGVKPNATYLVNLGGKKQFVTKVEAANRYNQQKGRQPKKEVKDDAPEGFTRVKNNLDAFRVIFVKLAQSPDAIRRYVDAKNWDALANAIGSLIFDKQELSPKDLNEPKLVLPKGYKDMDKKKFKQLLASSDIYKKYFNVK